MADASSSKMIFDMIAGLIGGLGIFLYGMKNMSEGMQAVAGNRLRKLISSVTNNRVSACGIGAAVTTLIQSSSVTTVMVVGFVSAGFMTLTQAIGVIMGANIGTTITGVIIALKIGKYGLPILGVASFFFLFSKNEKVRYTGLTILGLGMVFFGLQLMSKGLEPIRYMPEFNAWFKAFSAADFPGILKCIAAGCILTCIVQSSSATLGITMTLAGSGLIDFQSAAALVLGENIGTTITAFLASLGAPTNAKRAAYSHIIFNVLGVVWITLLFRPYMILVSSVIEFLFDLAPGAMELAENGEKTYPTVKKGIALVHSGFNIANTLLFLPFIHILAKVVTKLAPDKKVKESPHLTYLDIKMIDSPAIGIQQSEDEVRLMAEHSSKMMDILQEIMNSEEPDEKIVQKLFHREEVMDIVQKEVTEFLSHILSGNVTAEVIQRARTQLRLADEYETISDYAANILKLYLKKKENDIWFGDEAWKEVLSLHEKTSEHLKLVNSCMLEDVPDLLSKARTGGDAITHNMKEFRSNQLDRMSSKEAAPLAGLIFTDMLNAYRRVKDHALNIAEAVAGEK